MHCGDEMNYFRRDCFGLALFKPYLVNHLCSKNPFSQCLSSYSGRFFTHYSVYGSNLNPDITKLNYAKVLGSASFSPSSLVHLSVKLCSFYSTKRISRAFRKRRNNREKAKNKPVLDQGKFEKAISELPSRFSNEELCNVLTAEEDPLVCLELYNWASQQRRFRHDASTYHIMIKKLGVAKMYEEMDGVVNQVLAVPHIGNETLYNTAIYFFVENRKLTRAVNIYKHMKNSRNLDCRPSIRTYNILFTAMLSRGKNSYINHMYMETIRLLFKQMVDDGIEPDIFSLNALIKGYVLSLHVNDALRIFHQMGAVYKCLPNSFSYDYLIHGLCSQGRTNNARELCDEMKTKGFIPSSKSYNSVVNALALNGETEAAVKYLSEMVQKHRSVDFITYKTVLDEMCRKGMAGEAMRLLREWQERDLVDGYTYKKLQYILEDEFGDSNDKYHPSWLGLLYSLHHVVLFFCWLMAVLSPESDLSARRSS